MSGIVAVLSLFTAFLLLMFFVKAVDSREKRRERRELETYYGWPKLKKKPLYRRVRHRFRSRVKKTKRFFEHTAHRRRRRRRRY